MKMDGSVPNGVVHMSTERPERLAELHAGPGPQVLKTKSDGVKGSSTLLTMSSEIAVQHRPNDGVPFTPDDQVDAIEVLDVTRR